MDMTKVSLNKWIWGFLACFMMIGPNLSSAQVFRYKRSNPEKGYIIPQVPFEKWLRRNYCGPACLSMVLNYWDGTQTIDQQQITDEIYDGQNQATYNSEMVMYPQTKGFDSYSFQGTLQTLKDVVSQDIPVIVLTKTIKQIRKGHYRVVIGYDEEKDQIIFHDPYFGPRQAMKARTFMKTWQLGLGRNENCWMMAVLPSHSVFPYPALQNDPMTSINLATAYYRRSDYSKSRQQWEKVRTALSTDPYPLFSLAMISLRENKDEEAESLALLALNLDAANAYAHDVLGLAYAKQGKISLAFKSLGQASLLAPKEEFIRKHYHQVRDMYIKKSRLENKPNEGEMK